MRYGTDPNNLNTEINNGGATTSHSISLTGLSPATFYYVQVYTDSSGVEAVSPVRVYSTASESTGEVRIYFNNVVDVNFSTGVDAIYHTPAQVEQDIIGFIDNAQSTIDMCIYNINRAPIVTALNNAVDRGVVVRYIANNGTLNSALNDGAPSFSWIPLNGSALMHNKFMVVDRDSKDNSWVMSGSMNLTIQNIQDDFNNILFVQDQALAKAYTLEFNEMWGGTGDTPSIFALKVGIKKQTTLHTNF